MILPLISIIVCSVTLYLLFRYFKRSKRVLVHINLILALVINQCFFIGSRMIKKLYHMVIITVAKRINDSSFFTTIHEDHHNPWNLGSSGSYHGNYEAGVDIKLTEIFN